MNFACALTLLLLAAASANDPVSSPAGIAGAAGAVATGELGRAVALRCLAYGHPAPAIYWYRGAHGPMVPFSSALYKARGNTLTIRALALDRLGEYACQAYNGVGKPASWSVEVRAYRPADSSHRNPYLVPRDPRDPRDEWTARTPESTSTTTQVYEPFQVEVRTRLSPESPVAAPGGTLSLPCVVDGYPEPQVYWTKDGQSLQPNDRIQIKPFRLTISALTEADSGEYGCHAQNLFSSHSSTAQIRVQG